MNETPKFEKWQKANKRLEQRIKNYEKIINELQRRNRYNPELARIKNYLQDKNEKARLKREATDESGGFNLTPPADEFENQQIN